MAQHLGSESGLAWIEPRSLAEFLQRDSAQRKING